MNAIQKLAANIGLVFFALATSANANTQEAPDVLVRRISFGILEAVRNDKEVLSGNRKHVAEFVEKHIMQHVDFRRTTALAVGRHWREATLEQQQRLIDEFRMLLLHTYAGAMSQIKNPQLEFKPFRANPDDTDVEVRFQVKRSRGGEPVQVGYRLIRDANGWKIYDVSVLGVWLVETYRGSFAPSLNSGGVDALVRELSEKNKKLANHNSGGAKAF